MSHTEEEILEGEDSCYIVEEENEKEKEKEGGIGGTGEVIGEEEEVDWNHPLWQEEHDWYHQPNQVEVEDYQTNPELNQLTTTTTTTITPLRKSRSSSLGSLDSLLLPPSPNLMLTTTYSHPPPNPTHSDHRWELVDLTENSPSPPSPLPRAISAPHPSTTSIESLLGLTPSPSRGLEKRRRKKRRGVQEVEPILPAEVAPLIQLGSSSSPSPIRSPITNGVSGGTDYWLGSSPSFEPVARRVGLLTEQRTDGELTLEPTLEPTLELERILEPPKSKPKRPSLTKTYSLDTSISLLQAHSPLTTTTTTKPTTVEWDFNLDGLSPLTATTPMEWDPYSDHLSPLATTTAALEWDLSPGHLSPLTTTTALEWDLSPGHPSPLITNTEQDLPPTTTTTQAKQTKKALREAAREQNKLKRLQDKQLREAERLQAKRTATLNKQTVEYETTCKELTILVDEQWHADRQVGQPLWELCREDGTTIKVDERRTVPFSLTWERCTQSHYDEEQEMIVPLPIPIHVPVLKLLLKWEASELLDWIIHTTDPSGHPTPGPNPARFDTNLLKLSYPNYQILVLLMGTQTFLRKVRQQVSSAFKSQVRRLATTVTEPPSRPTPGRTSTTTTYELQHAELFEEYLIQLQMQHGLTLIQLETKEEALPFLHSMTREISALPHRPQYDRHLLNLPELAARKSTDPTTAWPLLLQQIHLVTPATALAITNRYPTLATLLTAYRRCPTDRQRQTMLQDLEVPLPAGPTKRLGPILSTRIYTTFHHPDPHYPLH